MKQFIILSISFIIGAGIGSWITTSIQNNISKTSTKSTILRIVDKNDNTTLYKAYKTPISITDTIKGNTRTITATDTYKQTVIVESARNNIIYCGIGFIHYNDNSYYVQIGYSHRIAQTPLFIGGAVQLGNNFNGLTLLASFQF